MNKITFILLIAILSLFAFLRLYKIDESLYFFGDYARDYLVLGDWARTGKPPLLGPQTSTLAYNQSAIYFYLLMPLFVLTNHSPYASVYTVTIVYISAFIIGYWLLKKTKYILPFLLVMLVVTIHPQFIIQTRGVWNPSFVGISIIMGIFSFLLYGNSKNNKHLYASIFLFSLATAFSYSAAPALIALLIYMLIASKQRLQTVAVAVISLFMVNLPTAAFEVRHRFFLTRLLFTGQRMEQLQSDLATKLSNLYINVLGLPHQVVGYLALTIFVSILILVLRKEKHTISRPLSILFAITLAITLLSPFNMASHYIFPLLTMGMILISLLSWPFSLAAILLLMFFWIQPISNGSYFQPSLRSAGETLRCAKKVCDNATSPLYVSSQSQNYPSHSALEFQYALKENGCTVYSLDTQPNQTSTMAVFEDDSNYDHGKTAFNELTQYGGDTSVVQQTIECNPKLKVYILQKQ